MLPDATHQLYCSPTSVSTVLHLHTCHGNVSHCLPTPVGLNCVLQKFIRCLFRESAQPSWVLVDSTMLLRHRGMTYHLCQIGVTEHLLMLDWSWKLFCFCDWFGTLLLRAPSRQTSVIWRVWNVCLLLLLLLLIIPWTSLACMYIVCCQFWKTSWRDKRANWPRWPLTSSPWKRSFSRCCGR